jgi:lysophospholipase L1-like esterase
LENAVSGAAHPLRKLGVGLLLAAGLLGALECGLRVVWYFAGPSAADDTLVIRNRFAPDANQQEVPRWLWEGMAPAQRANVVSNAMAYPDPEFIFRVRPNPGERPVLGFDGINALGFRTAYLTSSPLGFAKPIRVLHLGDSCAWGWGIRRFSETMEPRIEHRLVENGVSGDVINLAQPGFTSTQGLLLFERWFPKIHPQFVILQYGWNDRRTSRGFTDRQVMRMLPLLHHSWMKALMQTALYRSFAWTADALLPKPAQDPAHIDRDLDPVVDNSRMRVPLTESIANYGRMIDAAREAGARVIVILPPYRPSVRGLGPRMKDFHREVAAAFRDKATFLPLPAMRDPSPDLDSFFDRDGMHPNVRGVAYIADAIADEIARAVRTDGTVVEASAAPPAAQVAGSP